MDLFPKFSDIKSLRDVCRLFIAPFLVVAYLTDFEFSLKLAEFQLSLPSDATNLVWLLSLILIFLGKVLFIGLCAHYLEMIFYLVDKKYTGLTPFFSLATVSLGLLGVTNPELLSTQGQLSPFWYYASLAIGLYLPNVSESSHF